MARKALQHKGAQPTNQKGSFLKGHPQGPGAWANLAVKVLQENFLFFAKFLQA